MIFAISFAHANAQDHSENNLEEGHVFSLADCEQSKCEDIFEGLNLELTFNDDGAYAYDTENDMAADDDTGTGTETGSETDQDTFSYANEIKEIVQVGVLSEVIARRYDQRDKRVHARAGAYIGYFSKKSCERLPGLLELDIRVGASGQFFCALAGAAIAGVLKEVYDSTKPHKHTVDSQDAIATALGGLANIPLYRIEF